MKDNQQLDRFLEASSNDPRIGPVHVSLYVALYHSWNQHGCQSPFAIRTPKIMVTSRIHARSTYNKIMKELNSYGYIRYLPSKYPLKQSMVYLPPIHHFHQ